MTEADRALTRRRLVTGGLVLGLGGATAASLPVVATGADAVAAPDGALPDFARPDANLRHLVRMQGSLLEADVPWWFTGMIFAVVGEEQPKPLVRFEGMEMYWFSHAPDGFLLGGNTVTFFRDVETSAFLDEFRNPWTGRTDTVRPAVQGGRQFFHYGEQGIRPRTLKAEIADRPLRLQWHAMRDWVWLQHQTVYPPGMPPMHGQRQSMFVRREEFLDHRIAALPSAFSSTVFMGWLKWMDMKDQPGHVIWHASGVKLRSIADLPAEYRVRAEREFPERMTANPAVHGAERRRQ